MFTPHQSHYFARKIYLIRETKTTHDSDKRRMEENLKILCGQAHFDALDDVDYSVATTVAEVVSTGHGYR